MSETREILEQAFQNQAAAETQSPDSDNLPANGNLAEEQIAAASGADDPYLNAPASYKKEYVEAFKALTPEMRKYLHERESETEKGFSRLNNQLNGYKWMDEVFNARKERLGDVSARQYFEQLSAVDDCLAENPAEALKALAEYYDVNINPQESAQQPWPWQGEFNRLRQGYSSLQQAMQEIKNERATQIVSEFAGAKDDNGQAKHPYFEQVRDAMRGLLNSGAAQTMEDAYEKAVWITPEIREKFLADKSAADLSAKVAEAEKAKAAGFALKGKTAKKDLSEMSTREVLEMKMRESGLL